MGTSERKKREKKQRKNNILDAAEELISDKGLESVTMSAVARQSELSKGTLYLYFESKNELIYAIHCRGLDLLNQELSKILSQSSSGDAMIEALWKLGRCYPEEFPLYVEVFYYYEFHTHTADAGMQSIVKKCEQKRQQLFTLTKRILQVAIQDGSIKSDHDPKILTINSMEWNTWYFRNVG